MAHHLSNVPFNYSYIIWYLLFMSIVTLPTHAYTLSSVRSCSSSNDGEIGCIRVIGYQGLQYARCSNDTYVQDITNGTRRCGMFNVSRHCWLPCEKMILFTNISEFTNETCNCGVAPTVSIIPTNGIAVKQDVPEYLPDSHKLSNCSFLNDGEKKCMSSPDYTHAQMYRCASQSYVRQQSHGRYSCKNNNLYCWYSCQQETFRMEDGEVDKRCACESSNVKSSSKLPASSAASRTPKRFVKSSLLFILIMLLIDVKI